MSKKNKKNDTYTKDNPISYNVGKITFIITPVYNDEFGLSIYEILLRIMKDNSKKPYK